MVATAMFLVAKRVQHHQLHFILQRDPWVLQELGKALVASECEIDWK